MKLDTGIGVGNGARDGGTNTRGIWRIKCTGLGGCWYVWSTGERERDDLRVSFWFGHMSEEILH